MRSGRARGWLAAWWLLVMLMAGGAAHAVEPPAAVELVPGLDSLSLQGRSRYWIEDGQTLPVQEVERAGEMLAWQMRDGRQLRLDGKALWLQFDAVATAPGRWYLAISSSGLDRAQLFYRDQAGTWVVQEAGDSRAVSDWPLPGRVPTFELANDLNRSVRYWVRIEHRRVDFAAPMALYEHGRLLAAREREQFMLGAYFGLAALIAVVALANAAAYRDRSFFAYGVYVAMFALGQVAYLGVGAQHLWNEELRWNEVASFFLPGVSSAAALWFVHTVTEPARFSRALDTLVWALVGALLLAVVVDTAVESRATFSVVMLLTVLALAIVAVLIVLVWVRGDDPTIRLIALGFLPVLVMAVFPVARGLNLIPNSALTRYGLSIGAVLEMPILFYALSLRGSRRREAEVRMGALARNDTLTGLAHNRTLLQRLEAALGRARSQKHPCALMALKISNFEAIVSEFGRDAAEKALLVTASLVRRVINDADLAARVGDNKFALLLEGPTTSVAVMSRAQQVVASGLRPSDALPPGLALKFHVTVAMLPEGALDAAGSLRWLLEGLQAMPADARKLIRPLNF